MVATAAPFGMREVRKLGSNPSSQGFNTYKIASGYNTNIFFGDVVALTTDGTIVKDTGTATLTPIGVFVGCEYDGAGGLNYRLWGQMFPANTTGDINALVVDDPNAEFLIQANGSVAQTAIGKNAAIVQTAGTTQTGTSRNSLNASSIDVTASLPLRITDFGKGGDTNSLNEPGDAFTNVIVKFNNHQLTTLTGV